MRAKHDLREPQGPDEERLVQQTRNPVRTTRCAITVVWRKGKKGTGWYAGNANDWKLYHVALPGERVTCPRCLSEKSMRAGRGKA